MPKPIHPLLMEGLRIVGRAGLAALDSALGDAEAITEEGVRRVKHARARARKMAGGSVDEEEEE